MTPASSAKILINTNSFQFTVTPVIPPQRSLLLLGLLPAAVVTTAVTVLPSLHCVRITYTPPCTSPCPGPLRCSLGGQRWSVLGPAGSEPWRRSALSSLLQGSPTSAWYREGSLGATPHAHKNTNTDTDTRTAHVTHCEPNASTSLWRAGHRSWKDTLSTVGQK